jgi:hypothetical protein
MQSEGLDHVCTVNHVVSMGVDAHKQPKPAVTQSTIYPCQFYVCQVTVKGTGKSFYFEDQVKLMLPAMAVVQDGDTITSVQPGYPGNYRILDASLKDGPLGSPDHYECILKKVD